MKKNQYEQLDFFSAAAAPPPPRLLSWFELMDVTLRFIHDRFFCFFTLLLLLLIRCAFFLNLFHTAFSSSL